MTVIIVSLIHYELKEQRIYKDVLSAKSCLISWAEEIGEALNLGFREIKNIKDKIINHIGYGTDEMQCFVVDEMLLYYKDFQV